MASSESIPSVERVLSHGERSAVQASEGVFSYAALLRESQRVAQTLLAGHIPAEQPAALRGDGQDLAGARVCFLVPPSFAYVATLFGIWRAGGIAVPLCMSHPAPELEHVLDDSGADIVIAHPDFVGTLQPLAQARQRRFLCSTELASSTPLTAASLPMVEPARGALLIYTSGTTGKPKGALTTHAILAAQITSIVEAWEIVPSDRILHVLPLHHLHGILNALLAPLYAGACCEILPRFDAGEVWRRFSDSNSALTLFMAVPTIYSKLAEAWTRAPADEQLAMSRGAARLRLMVSGSAALPVSMLERWRAISGQLLLERYGMTEIGMGLGNPLHGERRPGHVGVPFPRVQARLVDDSGQVLGDGQPGALEIHGPNVFAEYWQRGDATRAAFTADGWFKTGDVAVRERDHYRLLGRSSVDILKTGGFKVSALEIEDVLREHPAIAEVSVIGVPDAEWGERVAAVIVLRTGATLELDALRAWGKDRLASYKVPSLLHTLHELPRNAMGKVLKPELQKLWGVTLTPPSDVA